jgi:hypothetical protein
MEGGGALDPACVRSGGAEGLKRGDVAAERGGLLVRGVGPEGGARVASAGEMLGIRFREAVDLVRAAMARAGGAMFSALGRQREGQGSEVVDDDPVVRGDRGAGAGREARFDLISGGAEVGDHGGGSHGGFSEGELHRFGAMTIALVHRLS